MKRYYIKERVEQVDPDFLIFEEEMSSKKDKDIILNLLSSGQSIKLPNVHNSILLYITGLTDIFDFQKGRSDTVGGSPPDIDIDFDALKREEAIDWVINRWGRDQVSNIASYGTFKPKSIARAYYRVTKGDVNELTAILNLIPKAKFGIEATLAEIEEQSPQIKDYPLFYENAKKLEDMVTHPGIHAAGIVISDFPIMDTIPTWTNSKSERITQFDKDEVEDLGLIKFDFLSIDTLSIIKETLRLLEKNRKIVFANIWDIPDGDEAAYSLMQAGLLTGIFQFETSGKSAELISAIKPKSIEELSDISALNRPGPMQVGIDKLYIANKDRGYPPDDLPKPLSDLLKPTYWTIVYQEQVMEVFSELAGFSLKEADDVRRAMGKKKKEVLEAYKAQFIEGFKRITKLNESYADEIWENILGFADYCFNKSHSCAYSLITYVTAYLKANYPQEFFCALMTIRSQSQPKIWASKAPEYINEAKALGVIISAPTINNSETEFLIKGNNIYFGLKAIRDVGNGGAKAIIKARGKVPFKDIYDFLFRVDSSKVNLKVIIALIKAGAFDSMGYCRIELEENIQQMMQYVSDTYESREKEILIQDREKERQEIEAILQKKEEYEKELKGLLKLKKKQPISEERAFELELEINKIKESKIKRLPALKPKTVIDKPEISRNKSITLTLSQVMEQARFIGCYITYHPVKMIGGSYDKLEDSYLGQKINFCGIVNSLTEKTTKRNEKMAFLEVDDTTGTAELIFFPGVWKQAKDLGVTQGSLLLNIKGKIENEDPLKIIAFSCEIYSENKE